jgi:hypothetical protein
LGVIREFQKAAEHGVSAEAFIHSRTFDELARGVLREATTGRGNASNVLQESLGGPLLTEDLSTWRQRHTARQEARDFKRGIEAGVALVAGPDEPRRDMAADVLQESRLHRAAARPAADRQEWLRSHRAR